MFDCSGKLWRWSDTVPNNPMPERSGRRGFPKLFDHLTSSSVGVNQPIYLFLYHYLCIRCAQTSPTNTTKSWRRRRLVMPWSWSNSEPNFLTVTYKVLHTHMYNKRQTWHWEAAKVKITTPHISLSQSLPEFVWMQHGRLRWEKTIR